ncbi:glutamyl-tRNA reductase [Sulfuricurvum kujiense DSM 16994]|uniref:Glutamyl-tRNA reductase n=1 Tax=Sulfuricurvum kujiense (strain ATCC BAA-921 / DSM 16994 / JCM 11577 / YK-1) TaxID=709032 RepID=E4U285_SULKY|nr:glutamyl-tRNA reductase [Sulfuricurvum kujiense]ADR33535.1 glutamyl-tRNA reductase [Sulfuricurvum kujiense DSM 16994]
MHYLIVSFSHKNSTLAIREKLAFVDETAQIRAMETLNANPCISESMVLSTCNRVEIVCSCSDVQAASDALFALLAGHSGLSAHELHERADIFDDEGGIHHLFSVASSLDSMVVGETQIAGQLKDAHKLSVDNGFSAQKIGRAMSYAFKCAAEVRNATNISSKPVSIASVAVAKVKESAGDISGKKALVIGSGEMSVITCKHLSAQGVDVTVMNRTFEKAEAIAAECNARVRSFEEISHAINENELLFTATGSLAPIITDDMIKPVPFDRYWFDMAVPRDIECDAALWSIALFYVDDLKEIVSENIALREDEAKLSYVIIRRHVVGFFEWLKTLSIEPLIKNMYLKASNAAQQESMRVIENGYIPKEYEYALQKATFQALKRFLHPFAERMRDGSDPMRVDTLIESMSFLMNQEEGSDLSQNSCTYYPKGK